MNAHVAHRPAVASKFGECVTRDHCRLSWENALEHQRVHGRIEIVAQVRDCQLLLRGTLAGLGDEETRASRRLT